MTASQRRAAGEAEFFDDAGAVEDARFNLHGATQWRFSCFAPHELDCLAALLRALVIATLLDPATWARPEGWRP